MRRVMRAVTLLVMMMGASGCFAWRTVGALPQSADLPADTRITRYDGSTITLAQSRITNDTIRGYVSGSNVRHVIPMAHVDLLEAKHFQAKQSVIMGALVGTALYVIVKGLQAHEPYGPMPSTPFMASTP